MATPITLKMKWVENLHGFSAEWLVEPRVEVMKAIARKHLRIPKDEAFELSFFDSGAFNRLYAIRIDGSPRSYLLRLTLPVCPHYKTASEVATILYVQQNTHIPVPIVVAYDSNADNALGFEWILMDMLPGKPLLHMWRLLSWSAKENLTSKLAEYQAQLFDRVDRVNRFDTAGSLYFSNDPNQPFAVGRILDRDFIDGNHVDEKKARGPYKNTTEMF